MFPQVRNAKINLYNDNRTQVSTALASSIIIKVALLMKTKSNAANYDV